MMYQAGVARFDPKTEKFETWSVPKEWQTDATQQAFVDAGHSPHVDGKVWVKNSDRAQILRLDPATGKWENLGSFKDPDTASAITSYGIPADATNNLYLLDFSSSNIGRLDAKTGELTVFKGDDRELASAPRPLRRAGPAVVRRIRRQRHRHARSEDRQGAGMGAADAVGAAL